LKYFNLDLFVVVLSTFNFCKGKYLKPKQLQRYEKTAQYFWVIQPNRLDPLFVTICGLNPFLSRGASALVALSQRENSSFISSAFHCYRGFGDLARNYIYAFHKL
jgi:hypothetical protein